MLALVVTITSESYAKVDARIKNSMGSDFDNIR